MNGLNLNKRETAIFILGAGASKDSGIPTYRGEGGVLSDPESALSVDSNPFIREELINKLKKSCENIIPGPTYDSIKKLASRYKRSFILTQNVDGLVRDLGIPYVEMHGNKDDEIVLYGQDIIFPPIAYIWIKQHFADVFVIGTSMSLPYLRKIINSLKRKGGKVIHINPDESYNIPTLIKTVDWGGRISIKNCEKVRKNEVWICKSAHSGIEEILNS